MILMLYSFLMAHTGRKENKWSLIQIRRTSIWSLVYWQQITPSEMRTNQTNIWSTRIISISILQKSQKTLEQSGGSILSRYLRVKNSIQVRLWFHTMTYNYVLQGLLQETVRCGGGGIISCKQSTQIIGKVKSGAPITWSFVILTYIGLHRSTQLGQH